MKNFIKLNILLAIIIAVASLTSCESKSSVASKRKAKEQEWYANHTNKTLVTLHEHNQNIRVERIETKDHVLLLDSTVTDNNGTVLYRYRVDNRSMAKDLMKKTYATTDSI